MGNYFSLHLNLETQNDIFQSPRPPHAFDFNAFYHCGGGGLRPPPPAGGRSPRRIIVGKYIEIECLEGSGVVKNRILCLQKQMGNRIGPHVLA